MIDSIKSLNAIAVISETNTKGSSPLFVIAEDDQEYFVKASSSVQPPKMELINELICSYFLKCWNIQTPEIALIKFDKQVVDAYTREKGPLSWKYKSIDFEKEICFASRQIKPVIEFEKYIKGLDKKQDFHLFRRPLDFLKIGVFDIWVANKDRKPENPNILVSGFGKFDFNPIDHAAAWGYLCHPMDVTIPKLYLEEKFRILNVPLSKSIAKFTKISELKELQLEIHENILTTLKYLDFIFEQVPKEWGLSDKGKNKIRHILADNGRNLSISKSYLSYLK